MLVDVPCDGRRSIRERALLFKVFLRENIVSNHTVPFALAANRGNPCETVVREFLSARRDILEVMPVGEDGQESVIANLLRLLRHVPILARLLRPASYARISCAGFTDRERPV